jgi:hypothetical protein
MHKLRSSLQVLLVCAVLVVGFTATQVAPLPTPPPITPLPSSREPDWLSIAFPKPGQTISLEQYNDPNFWRAGGVVATLSPATICFDISARWLLEKGDFWNAKDVVQRTTVLVDDLPRGVVTGTLASGMVAYIMGLPPVILPTGAPTPLATQVPLLTATGGPYGWCVSAPLTAGLHRAEVRFQRSSGKIQSFAWTFTLTAGEVPTPTALPTPAQIDAIGALPEYLKLVYPLPGISTTFQQAKDGWREYFNKNARSEYRPTTPSALPVCVAFEMTTLERFGTLPKEENERIYLQIDDTLLHWEDWLWFPANERGSSVRVQCAEWNTPILGDHVVTLYADFFNAPMLIYSWKFSIHEP